MEDFISINLRYFSLTTIKKRLFTYFSNKNSYLFDCFCLRFGLVFQVLLVFRAGSTVFAFTLVFVITLSVDAFYFGTGRVFVVLVVLCVRGRVRVRLPLGLRSGGGRRRRAPRLTQARFVIRYCVWRKLNQRKR